MCFMDLGISEIIVIVGWEFDCSIGASTVGSSY